MAKFGFNVLHAVIKYIFLNHQRINDNLWCEYKKTTMITLNVNGNDVEVDAKPDELLVWVINEKVGLTSTKFGCGIETCGACKVLVDGETTRSCVVDVGEVIGKKITTKEGVPDNHPLKTGEKSEGKRGRATLIT